MNTERVIERLANIDSLERLTTLLFGQSVTIFTLHRAKLTSHPHAGTDPTFLDSTLENLQSNGFSFVSLEEVILAGLHGKVLPQKAACFTLDDGYADQADILLPIFIKHRAKPTFFIITDMLDGTSWPWDEKITYALEATKKSDIPNPFSHLHKSQATLLVDTKAKKTTARRYLQAAAKEISKDSVAAFLEELAHSCAVTIPETPPTPYQPMTWERARELESQGAFFAPHSCDHSIFSRLTKEESEYQINQSWQRLESELHNPVKIFCYPTGRLQDFTAEHMHFLEKQKFLGAVSFVSKPCKITKIPEERFKLPRIALPNTLSAVKRYASWIEKIR